MRDQHRSNRQNSSTKSASLSDVAKGVDTLRTLSDQLLNSRIDSLSVTIWGRALCQHYGRESLIEFLQEHDGDVHALEPAIKEAILSWCQSEVDVYKIKPRGLTQLGCSRGEAGDKLGQLVFDEIAKIIDSGELPNLDKVVSRTMKPFLLSEREFTGPDISESKKLLPDSYETGKKR